MIFEIVILAMIAAFLGLRLYSVLGRRAEHEEEPIPTRFDQPEPRKERAPQIVPRQVAPAFEAGSVPPVIERGLQEIAARDRNFDLSAFMKGAEAAYGMILEAYWRGDREELRQLCDEDVYGSFAAAIDAREAAGETLDNRLVRIEDSVVHSAMLVGNEAHITVRFAADIASVTRDKDGNVIAGSLDDAIQSVDIWTFSRHLNSGGPDWVLEETDAG